MNIKQLKIIILITLWIVSSTLWQTAWSSPDLKSAGKTTADDKISILHLSTFHVTEAKLRLFSRLAAEQGTFNVDYKYLRKLEEGISLTDLVSSYDLVIFDSVSGREAKKAYADFASLVKNDKKRRYLPVLLTEKSDLRRGITAAQSQKLYDYYASGGEENLRQMLVFLKTELFSLAGEQALPPIIFPYVGIYHPAYENKVFSSLADYKAWLAMNPDRNKTGKTTIGIAMSRQSIAADETLIIDTLIDAIETQGGIAVPFYYRGSRDGEYIDLLSPGGKVAVDNIINYNIIHWADRRRAEYEKLGVPVLQVLPYSSGDQAQWEADQAGLSAMVTPFFLTMPEIAGITDPMVISAKGEDKYQLPIDYQLNRVVKKAFNIAALKHKTNSDKKVAIMFYNYPAGEKNVSASFLNVPTSLAAIFSTLKGAAYTVEEKSEQWFIDNTALMLKPFYRELPHTDLLQKTDGNDSTAGGLLPLKQYLAWYNTLPASVRREIEAQWGLPENSFTVTEVDGEKQFIIPRMISGNVMVLPQPPRGERQDRANAIYHDKLIPINHNYLAVYLYVREQFSADAIVHLGTHGSQEWLPGKERGLSVYDAGNLAVGDTPILYPFIMDNVGEALQTKRRGRATVISHLTPPFSKSGLYEELLDMHDLMHQYAVLDDGGVKSRTQKTIMETVAEQSLDKDIGWSQADIEADFDTFLHELHDYLKQLQAQSQPLGLHSFGDLPKQEHLISTLVQMLGTPFATLAQEYADKLHDDDHKHDRVHDHGHSHSHGGAADHEHASAIDYRQLQQTPEFRLIADYVVANGNLNEIADDKLRELVVLAKTHYANFQGIEENSALLQGLSGEYISSSAGGDPIRSPEAMPSGRNLYGFDPSKIPIKQAWETGKELIDDLIHNYHQEHGVFPDKLTFSLWSIETMRHLGVIESQVLYAMGMRPVWSKSGRVIATEIIPYSELKRPRVDVVVSATGLYRDAFPNIMMMLAKAVEQVAKLKEEHNFVFRHSEKLKAELIEQGVSDEEAEMLSTIRVFSNQSGNYGTNLNSASLASDTWQEEDKLAKLYLSRMGFFYGSDDKTWGKRLADIDLYAKNLSGTDAVVFSRSSNLYGLLTSDDPFQYMGGVSLAVRHLDGKSPQMFISNLRDPNNNHSQSMAQFLATELRTRQFHPQWIKAMQAEGYAGTLNTLDVLNNFWGWQVVDPDNVRDDQWQEFFEVYVQDKYQLDMQQWYEDHNAHALAQMLERMLEAVRKEYWATDADTIKELTETYIELAQKYDVLTNNKAFEEYLNQQAAGFGLAPLTPTVQQTQAQPEINPQPNQPAQRVQVEGQVMEKVQQQESEEYRYYYLIALLLLFFVAGFLYQFSPFSRSKRQE